MESENEALLELLDEAFDAAAWHGPSLLLALRGVDRSRALWRPGPSRPCIWEIVLHCGYWKHRVRRRLAPGSGAGFPRRGRDWPRLPESPTAAAWRADVALLREEHRRLKEVVAAYPPGALRDPAPGHRGPAIEQIRGIALHDVYHAGQIRLLRRLAEGAQDRAMVAG
ncbi:MAG TPA: DinB family protein [Longimicrobiales bacterium]